MKKIVNVKAIYPITGVEQIVRGSLNKAEMSTEDIFKCLCGRAEVTEVIGDTLIPLTFDNYNKNNKPTVVPAVIPTEPKINIPASEPVKSEVKTVIEPVATKETTIPEKTVESDNATITENSTITESEVTEDDTTKTSENVAETSDEDETNSSEEATETTDETSATEDSSTTNNYNRRKHRR